MRKFRLKLMTALTLIFVLLTTVGFAADTKTYNATKDFQTDKQGPVWFYQYNNGSGFKNSPHYFAKWGCWSLVANPETSGGPYSNIGANSGKDIMDVHPDKDVDGKKTTLAVMWKSPGDGKVTIAGGKVTHIIHGGQETADLKASITHNNKDLWSSVVKNGENASFDQLTVDVKKGDEIRFISDAGDRNGYNNLEWPIVVTFEGEIIETPSNPQTGDAGLATYGFLAALAVAGMALVVRRK